MMREILFRGKQKYSGKWVYGSFFSPNAIMKRGKEFDADKTYTILPETVGQFTGLTDKNDKKIFEGDIVLVPYVDPIFKCTWNDTSPCEGAIIKYCMGMFYVEYIESGDKFTLSAMDGYMKIIGNIYDNPELLGGNG